MSRKSADRTREARATAPEVASEHVVVDVKGVLGEATSHAILEKAPPPSTAEMPLSSAEQYIAEDEKLASLSWPKLGRGNALSVPTPALAKSAPDKADASPKANRVSGSGARSKSRSKRLEREASSSHGPLRTHGKPHKRSGSGSSTSSASSERDGSAVVTLSSVSTDERDNARSTADSERPVLSALQVTHTALLQENSFLRDRVATLEVEFEELRKAHKEILSLNHALSDEVDELHTVLALRLDDPLLSSASPLLPTSTHKANSQPKYRSDGATSTTKIARGESKLKDRSKSDEQKKFDLAAVAAEIVEHLSEPLGRQCFTKFLQERHAEESLYFYLEVQKLENMLDHDQVLDRCRNIYNTFISTQADFPINIPHKIASPISERFSSGQVSAHMFREAVTAVLHLLATNDWFAYLGSETYIKVYKPKKDFSLSLQRQSNSRSRGAAGEQVEPPSLRSSSSSSLSGDASMLQDLLMHPPHQLFPMQFKTYRDDDSDCFEDVGSRQQPRKGQTGKALSRSRSDDNDTKAAVNHDRPLRHLSRSPRPAAVGSQSQDSSKSSPALRKSLEGSQGTSSHGSLSSGSINSVRASSGSGNFDKGSRFKRPKSAKSPKTDDS